MKRLMALAVIAVALVACGSDDDTKDTTSPPSTAAALAGGAAINVTAADYSFTGLPATAKAGSKFAMKNASDKEVHEMIMIRIPDTEKRPVSELVALPEAEADAIFANVEPATVLVALPGQEAQAVEGDGTVTEPGRYAVVCFIPVGADPKIVEDAMKDPNPTGPPNMGDGPPHVTKGMSAEITIE
jgi:hypothetical protein